MHNIFDKYIYDIFYKIYVEDHIFYRLYVKNSISYESNSFDIRRMLKISPRLKMKYFNNL